MGERLRAGDGDPTPPTQPITFQVEPEVYTSLATLEKIPGDPYSGKLGNAYTKRRVNVMKTTDDLPYNHKDVDLNDGKIAVRMVIRQANRYVDDDYFFTIDPQGTTTEIESRQYGGHRNQQPLPPFSGELLLRELKAAQKTQPTLKPRSL